VPISVASLPQAAGAAKALLPWYDAHARVLPWRAAAGVRPDPYHVWLSEVMLQQTTVAAVDAYFRKFLARWPSVAALAAAPVDEVLAAWAGLGYYARARNLHKCAKHVAELGGFPTEQQALKALPGIGDYTAAAIAAIAFDRPAVVVDGNIERVISRLFRITEPLPGAKKRIKAHAAALTPEHRPGDYAQAMMDLGATICTPTRPRCLICPLRAQCAAHAAGDMERYPIKPPKKPKPVRRTLAFWLEAEGAVLLRRRPDKGLLGGMLEVPSTPWTEQPFDPAADHSAHAPVAVAFQPIGDPVRHTFTHFHLDLWVATARLRTKPPVDGRWVALCDLHHVALPTVMKKVAKLARSRP